MVIWLRWLFAIYANLLPFSFLAGEKSKTKTKMGKTKKSKDEITYHRPRPLMNRNQSQMDARFGPETFFSSIFLPPKGFKLFIWLSCYLRCGSLQREDCATVALDADSRTWDPKDSSPVCLTFLCLPETSILQKRFDILNSLLDLANFACLEGAFRLKKAFLRTFSP